MTGNKHKFQEAEIALKGSNVKIHLLDAEKKEPDDWRLEEVAKNNAKRIADETKKIIIIEDTGVFFEAFENFPGNKPKRYFEQLGYEGLLGKFNPGNKGKAGKKDEIKNRSAYFKTVIGYCEPGKEPMLFTGILKGTKIGRAKEVKGLEADVLPYERIFICNDGKHTQTRYLFEYTRDEKNKFSHRAQAFRKLKKYLKTLD